MTLRQPHDDLHEAMIADALLDADDQTCPGCGGDGLGGSYWGGSTVGWVTPICAQCRGTGMLPRPPRHDARVFGPGDPADEYADPARPA